MGLGRRRTTLAALVLTAGAGLSGCGSEPPPSPPSGVDGLTIPQPTPDPGAFTSRLTNPWLALEPGAYWQYESDGGATRIVRVTDETVVVQGVTTTVVHTEELGASKRSTAVRDDLYAQDRAGNVWLFGQRVLRGEGRSWTAGVDGDEAGLAMAATPRRGDGYAVAEARGADEDRVLVLSLDAQTTTPLATYRRALLVETTSELRLGDVVRSTYARGTGLVAQDGVQGSDLARWQLVATTPLG